MNVNIFFLAPYGLYPYLLLVAAAHANAYIRNDNAAVAPSMVGALEMSGWHGCWLVACLTEVIGLEMWFPALLTFPCQTALFVDFLETGFVFLLL